MRVPGRLKDSEKFGVEFFGVNSERDPDDLIIRPQSSEQMSEGIDRLKEMIS